MSERRTRSVVGVVPDGWDRLSASDPGLNRLRMAIRGVVAMGTILGVEFLIAGGLGRSSEDTLIAMLLGAIVAMMGSMGLSSGPAGGRAATAAMFPVSIGVGMVVGTAVASSTDLLLGIFVVVLFVAVYVRRFGQRFFFAGFMVWMGYFFASFLRASYEQIPWLLLYTTIAAVWVLALSLTVLQENPTRILRHTLRSFTTRAEALADAAADLLEGQENAERKLQRRLRRMNETALMVEGQLANDVALPEGWSAQDLRRWLTDAELALDETAFAAGELRRQAGDKAPLGAASTVLRRLGEGDTDRASTSADELIEARGMLTGEAGFAARRLGEAVHSYAECTTHMAAPQALHSDDQAGGQEFTPSVTLMMGRLPSSSAVASKVSPASARWNPLARLSMTTRQAIQVALAGGLAIVAGRALSEQRYYWAVIAAFVAFTGTATRSETLVKAVNRVVGTAAGLGLAIWLAKLTGGQTDAVIATILASMFLGFYLQQISYAFMIFFITIMVAQLYSVLGEFSDHLLVLRLEETAIGAAIGILVALVVLPVRTTDTGRAARANFYSALQELLEATAERLGTGTNDKDLDGLARSVSSHLYQLRQILQPLTAPLALRGDADQLRHHLNLYAATSAAARAVASAARTATTRTNPTLAQASRHLAAAAGALADPDDPDTPDETAALAAARASLDTLQQPAARADQPVARAVQPLERPLGRLVLALEHLADVPATASGPLGRARRSETVPTAG